MDKWELLDLAINALIAGVEVQELRAQAQQWKADGKSDDEVKALLRQMADDEIAAAQAAIDEKQQP